jgi:hypothetical protein
MSFTRIALETHITHMSTGVKFYWLASTCSVETTYGINSVISKLMTLVENAETGKFLFLIVLILSCFICP